jgi:hypothetical protein
MNDYITKSAQLELSALLNNNNASAVHITLSNKNELSVSFSDEFNLLSGQNIVVNFTPLVTTAASSFGSFRRGMIDYDATNHEFLIKKN